MLKRVRGWFTKSRVARGGGSTSAARAALQQGRPGGWATDHAEESRQYQGWNYIAVRAKALQAAQADCEVYQSDDAATAYKHHRKRLRARQKGYNYDATESTKLPLTHPLVKLLKRPNPHQSGSSFRYEQIMQLDLTGSCYVWNVPNDYGLTVERYVLPTALLQPVLPSKEYPSGGWRINPTGMFRDSASSFFSIGSLIDATPNVIPVEEMQVIRWPHPLYKDDGQSPVSAGAKYIDTAEMLDERRWNHMIQGPEPSFAFTPDNETDWDETAADRMVAKITKKIGGIRTAGQIFAMPHGKVTPLGTTPKEMGYTETFTQYRDTIMALQGTPPIAAGVSEGGSYAAFYASLKQFTTLTIQPELNLLAEEDTEQLAPQFGEGLIVEYVAQAIDDPAIDQQRLSGEVAAGAITVNEYRAERGRPPLEGEAGTRLAGPQPLGGSQPPSAEPEVANIATEDQEDELVDTGDGDERSSGITAPRMMAHFGSPRLNGQAGHAKHAWGSYP